MALKTIILAAGDSTRMKSSIPKLLHRIAGKKIIEHLSSTVKSIKSRNVIFVLNKKSQELKKVADHFGFSLAYQNIAKGTADAAKIALKRVKIKINDRILILCGDVPFITKTTLSSIINKTNYSDMCIGVSVVEKPFGYGRIIRNNNKIITIVEEKDASSDIKKINEINTGIICIKEGVLRKYLKLIDNNNKQTEFYLTDLVKLLIQDKHKITSYKIKNIVEIMGINTKEDLVNLEIKNSLKKALKLLEKGVLVRDINRIDIRGDLKAQPDVEIDINCIFEDKVSIGSNSRIGHNCYLNRCKIGNNVNIKPNTIIFGSIIGDNCTVGPYARVRTGTTIKKDVQIGNFVEIKNSTINSGTRINHLSYIGDAVLGSNINIGAGTITCNFDGEKKHKTIIENNSFIGSGTKLVAPIKIAAGSYIGAGSTLTKDTSGDGTLTIARSKQISVRGWKRRKGKK